LIATLIAIESLQSDEYEKPTNMEGYKLTLNPLTIPKIRGIRLLTRTGKSFFSMRCPVPANFSGGKHNITPHRGGNLRQTALQDRMTVVRNGYLLKMLTYFWC
jgi:hypothetical protein